MMNMLRQVEEICQSGDYALFRFLRANTSEKLEITSLVTRQHCFAIY